MSQILQRAAAEIQQRRLLPRGRKILVAVSGGADSMVLLQVLHSLRQAHRWQLSVAHFNHQLRGQASDADEKLVRATAEKWSLPLFCERGDVSEFACRSKVSVEMAARKLRHEFLARTAQAQKMATIALAHHADDQIELFFLRLLRGAGGEGLGGMKWRSPSPAHAKVTLVRPLLVFSKIELLAFAREKRIRFRDDASNASADILRNRIRNELLPLLRQSYQPGLAKTVLRVMEITGAEAELASETARHWLDNLSGSRGGEARIAIGNRSEPSGVVSEGFERLPVAVQRKVLQAQLTQLGLLADFDLIEQLRRIPETPVSVRSDLTIARDAAGKVGRREPLQTRFNLDGYTLKLSGRSGLTEFAGRHFRWRVMAQRQFRRPAPQDGVEFFDADKVGREIKVRHWRAGDRFQPIGLKSAAKLQDLFVNAKIPAAERRKLVLATTATDEIFWVEGLRIGEIFKLTPTTKRRFYWHFESSPAVAGTR